ncbi:MAG: arylsulfatase [Verrucomicrobiota bacterium]
MKSVILLATLLATGITQANPPNVVLIMADDLGMGDISFYHRERTGEDSSPVPTPNIDRLIEMGMRFSDAHSPSALCAPTRFAMLTGNYPIRNAKPDGVWGVFANPLIDPDFTTIARIAKEGGYQTAFFGKWGLGGNWEKRPVTAEDFSSFPAGALSYGFDYALELPAGIQDPPYAFYENRQFYPLAKDSILTHIPVEQTGYDLDLAPKAASRDGMGDSNWDPRLVGPRLAGKAVVFMENHVKNHPDQPFFLYYCSQAVHVPHVAAPSIDGQEIVGKTPGILGDFIYEFDLQIGELLSALESLGVMDDTLIILTSDNGGLPPRWDMQLYASGHRSNGGLDGYKGGILEGGHRVPFIAVWKDHIPAGSVCDTPIVSLDVVATLSDLIGLPVDRNVIKDSASLLPIFRGEDVDEQRHFIHQSGGIRDFAIRQGDWKLTIDGDAMNRPKPQRYAFNPDDHEPSGLFNLGVSLSEDSSENLIENPEHRERVEAMFAKYVEIRSEQIPTVD